MFSSAGYFKGLLCPFFLSGLCERPYCHFKHSKPEEGKPQLQRSTSNSSYIESLSDKPWSAKSSTSTDCNTDLEEVKLNHNNSAQVHDNSGENINSAENKTKEVIGYNKYTGEPIYEKFKQETYEVESTTKNVPSTFSTSGNAPIAVNKYTGKPIYENENVVHQITQNSTPEYKPTPIEELKKQNKNAQQKDNEYDPEQNYSTKTITASHSLPYAPKRTISYEPTIIRPKKVARKTSYEFDISKFSDSDDSENGKLDDEDEEYSPVPVLKEKSQDDKTVSVQKETTNTKDKVNIDKVKFLKDLKYFSNLLLSDPKKSTLEEIRKSKASETDENSQDNDTAKKNNCSENGEDNKIENGKLENKSTKRKSVESQNDEKDVSQSKKSKPSTDLDDKNNKISKEKTEKDSSVKNKHSSSKHSHSSSSKSSHSKSESSHKRKDSGSDSHKKSSSSHRKSDSSHKESSTNDSDSHKNSSHKKDEKTKSQDKHDKTSKSDSKDKKSDSDKHSKDKKSNSDKYSKDKKSDSDKHSKDRKSESSKFESSKPEKHDKSSSVDKQSSSDRKHSHKSSHDHKHSSKSHSGSSKERNHSNKSSGDTHKTDERKKHHSSKSSTSEDKHGDKSDKSSKVRSEKKLSTDSDSKRHIVDINVDLFGEDSDADMLDDSDIESHPLLDDSDLDDGDLHDECLRIYKESKETKTKHVKKSSPEKKKKEEPIILGKKRVAHDSGKEVVKKIVEKPHSKLSPAQVMHNRFLEMRKKALEEAVKFHSNTSSSSNNISSFSSNKTPSRVAHKPASSTKSKPEKTVITTASKTEKRKARIPDVSNLARPQIPAEFGSKVPTNIRQRYLNSIIDECLKLYDDAEEAFKRGQEEEMAVYKRSNTKTIYLNVAINAIKRLRNEIAENLPSTSKQEKTISAMKLSHEAVLGGKNATKASYTVKRSGQSNKVIENFKGDELYKRLSRYILTETQLKENGFPMADPFGTTVIYYEKNYKKNDRLHEKICVRCGNKFIVYPNGKYAKQEECIYHWAKAWKKKVNGIFDSRYNCCGGDSSSEGCQVAKNHVHETNKWENLTGYMRTLPCSPPVDGDYGVFAMDCEMVYTTAGVELARVTVSDQDNNAVYETLVKPDNDVVDLNTRFSGITEDDLEDVTTSLRDVQAVLLSLFTDKTILIGHSLESDLMAVKIIHKTVVDTSVVFPHRLGPPYKRALRTLMAEYLQKIIQDDVGGHDSMEDAVSCMELMHMKIKEDARKENR